MLEVSRREFLGAALLTPALLRTQPSQAARLVGVLPLGNPSGFRTAPLGQMLGTGLSARLFTDLSKLSPDDPQSLVTRNDQFFVRTAAPAGLADLQTWTIDLGGLVEWPARASLAALAPQVRPAGRFVMECSGNADPANYGLLSAADWEGVPIQAVLDRVRPSTAQWRVLVSGVDDPADPGRTSVPGASWIFSREDLRRAFLATRMNGAPLPLDHGAPIRLIVPGWYGCACIKWVNRVDLVADDAPATPQMREYASRTHQQGQPERARDYEPAAIDAAAMPVRVEKWTDGQRIFYRVAGIVWGGATPTNALAIRFRSSEPWTRVEHCPLPASTDAWTIWTHTWRPAAPGRYDIVLRVDDPSIRTRRLDIFFYTRAVVIDEV